MKKSLLPLLLLLLISSCASKKEIAPKSVADYINTITSESLKSNLTVIASDEMEGRETGSEGQKKAGRYLIQQHQNNGLTFPKGASSFYQPIPAAFLNAKYNENLPYSENIWAFI